MSGHEPHAGHYQCADVMYRIYEYLDGEMDQGDMALVAEHLQECRPCLAQHDLEVALKSLVQRSCGCDRAPAALRMQVLQRITMVRFEMRDRQ